MPTITPLYSAEEIKARVDSLSRDIDNFIPHSKEPLLVVIVLRGSLFFAADLLRNLHRETELRFITASSYKGGTESTGNVDLVMEQELMAGRTVLIVEDIIDTGRTLKRIVEEYDKHGAKKIYTVAFLDKPSRRVVDFNVDFFGFEIDDLFVVGYGMDYDEKYRSIPYIGEFKE